MNILLNTFLICALFAASQSQNMEDLPDTNVTSEEKGQEDLQGNRWDRFGT